MKRSLWAFSAVGLLACSNAAQPAATSPGGPAESPQAEYAVRWEVKLGGPRTADEVLSALGKMGGKPDQYQVEYFDVTPPANAPAGFKAILRKRTKSSGKQQLMFKYRGDGATAGWSCPLPSPDESKEEVDVSFLDGAPTVRAYSYSCTIKGAKDPPAELRARPRGCAAAMTRFEVKDPAGELKIEEWRLPGDIVVIEVSREGQNAKEAENAFRKDVVDVLVKLGARPSARGMSELAGQCVPGGVP